LSDTDFSDFTERSYTTLLVEAKRHYSFERYGTTNVGQHVIWRHDVDISVHRAVRLAELEREQGVRATYCFWLHSPFYSLLERGVADRAKQVLAGGEHVLGLHFETGHYGRVDSEDQLAHLVGYEASLLEHLLERPVEAFSFHNPGSQNDDFAFEADVIGGLPNAYSAKLRSAYAYISDSNGYWRHQRLPDVLHEAREERLHVLTHPVWWQVEPMPPRARVARSIEGRAARTLREYDEVLADLGRPNVG
jgi:hypothetical protein